MVVVQRAEALGVTVQRHRHGVSSESSLGVSLYLLVVMKDGPVSVCLGRERAVQASVRFSVDGYNMMVTVKYFSNYRDVGNADQMHEAVIQKMVLLVASFWLINRGGDPRM